MIRRIKAHFTKRKLRKAQQKEYLNTLPSHYDDGEVSWQAKDYFAPHRGVAWKICMVAVLVGIFVFGVLYEAVSFFVAMLVFALVYYIVHRQKPQDVEIVLSKVGIKVGKRKYPYAKIKHFCLQYDPPYTKALKIHVEGDLAVEVVIQLGDQNPAEVREFLLDKISEREGHQESLTDIFLKLLKI